MTNPSKIGHDYERAYRNELRRRGYHVTRSAASKGPFDLIGYSAAGTLFVACTRRRLACRTADFKASVLRELVSQGIVRYVHTTHSRFFCEHDR